jgi:hypothetical protein
LFALVSIGIVALSLALAAGLGYALGYWLPRFSAGIAGPGLLMVCAYVTFAHQELFDTSGNEAIPIDLGPLIVSASLVLIATLGLVAWGTGVSRGRSEVDTTSGTATRSDESDFSRYVPREIRWLTPWRMLGAAGLLLLGIVVTAIVIG